MAQQAPQFPPPASGPSQGTPPYGYPVSPPAGWASSDPSGGASSGSSAGWGTPIAGSPGAGPAAPPPRPGRRTWVLVGLGALVVALLGLLVGYTTAPDSSSSAAAVSPTTTIPRATPRPTVPQNDDGNGLGTPNNGNGTDDGTDGGSGSGNGSGDDGTAPQSLDDLLRQFEQGDGNLGNLDDLLRQFGLNGLDGMDPGSIEDLLRQFGLDGGNGDPSSIMRALQELMRRFGQLDPNGSGGSGGSGGSAPSNGGASTGSSGRGGTA